MRKTTIFFLLLWAAVAQAQPTPTANTKVRVQEGNNHWMANLGDLLGVRPSTDSTWAKTAGGYTNKRITDPVYRFAPFGVGSTDTTGRLNLLGVSTTKPGIYARYLNATANGYLFFSLDPDAQTNNSTVGNFNFWATNFDGVNAPYSTRANHVWREGYNTSFGGGREIATDADLHVAYESNFYNVYSTGRRKRSVEWHLQSMDSLGGVHRIISADGAHDGRDGEISFQANRFSVKPYSNANKTYFDLNYISKYANLDSVQFRWGAPQVGMPFLQFRNAANSAYLPIMQADASNRLVLNPSANDLYTYAPNFIFNTLGTITTADANPVNIGDATNKSFLSIYGPATEVLRLRSNTGGANLWKTFVNADNIVYALPSGSAYMQFYTNSAQIIGANSRIGIGVSPQNTLDVNGTLRIRTRTGTATNLAGLNGNGEVSDVSTSAELSLASNILKIAQQGATTGQVLEWNGTAWAPATDDGGAGGGNYQTVRDDGTNMTQRAALNFVSTSTVTAVATDDSGNNETEIALSVPTDGIGAAQIVAGAVGSSELASMSATAGQVLKYDGSAWGPAEITTDATQTDLSADANNYSPTNWATVKTHFLTSSGGVWTITGLAALPGGTERTIVNDGNLAMVVATEHTGSTAANRVAGNGDYPVSPGGSITFVYNATTNRWYVQYNTFSPDQLGASSMGQYFYQSPGSTNQSDHPFLGLGVSGTGATNSTLSPGAARPAGWQVNTGTTAAGVGTLFFPKNITNFTRAGDGHIVAQASFELPALSNGTQRFTIQFGLIPTASSTTLAVNNSVVLRYKDDVNAGEFEFVTRNNAGTETATDCNISVAANTMYTATVVLNEPMTEARCYISTNGGLPVLAAVNTTNLPTSGTSLGVRIGCFASVGTTGKVFNITTLAGYVHY